MRAVAERTIVLSDEDAALLDRLVADGGYRDADEALHQSLELAELAQGSEAMRVAAFKAAIQLGRDDVAAGRVTRFASADEITAHFLGRPIPRQRSE
jgi:Arc/MetJ-type ribon-helix-helix transcriptional regulator